MKFQRQLCTLSGLAISCAVLAQAPSAFDFGTLSSNTSSYNTADFVSTSTTGGTIKWYKFSLDTAASNALGSYLDIDTIGSNFDTELGLFDSSGTLLVTIDDGGPDGSDGLGGGKSLLSFGLFENPARKVTGAGNYFGAFGQNGALSAGIYYIALAGFDASFSNAWTVTTTSTNTTGTSSLNLRTNIAAVPEPASLAALGLGVVALMRKKRR